MAQNLDLLGDPIPENFGGRGRPAHIPTQQNRNKVMLLLAVGWEEAKVAAAIGITKPTLKKHYSSELRVRAEARARLDGSMLYAMAAKALQGDAQAFREVRRVLEKADAEAADGVYRATAPAPKAPKLGKKEERQQAAERVGGMYAPGAPPARLTH